MTLDQLGEDQRLELKQNLLTERLDKAGESPSYGELADADALVSDEELRDAYGDTEFVEDDFFC